ncbi:type II toxin-antitoxin system VapC family toxin [Paraconexibacter algicola]|uniref:VapC toxin family PIN domain ribonuclease n=1 Tax=Paraconexibacter algicola TaxID=2133960 RepID=A0A2T4UJ84_9ACTN|nr:type II toxin-antitoxin system VapC family toxin [Paraconexibacter algicola]PTL59301.1 VapC toxin family PIN domain ribonuclease [Paraconexibacter algicola]
MSDAAAALTYIDTSAAIKLVFEEAESVALGAWLTSSGAALVSSALLEVEFERAVKRAASQGQEPNPGVVAAVLSAIDLIDLDVAQLRVAAQLPDPYLRALDAIHIAAALALAPKLATVVTYDVRMLRALAARSIPTASPA